ncbi:hypothetical protein EJ08DRAFT_130517 [Tothia fuscella]|uniref:Heterokaryon incompatibility domain-containing protein n=1 Tax=Tothia fuscella TaxID=1048955 RepID=A0A9P4NWC5_9PEZI|nr:hypothetical protein EJ08DRAFT_130517 [Tothia fuscella]
MLEVYKNGVYNVAASDGTDDDAGLFHHRKRVRSLSPVISFSVNGFRGQTVRVVESKIWERHLEAAHLYSRGWVLQERLLAPWFIHFTRNQLFWECRELSACESMAHGQYSWVGKLIDTPQYASVSYHSRNKTRSIQNPFDQHGCGNIWHDVVYKYSVAQLTFWEDRVIAIAGLARHLKEVYNDDYCAGIWRRDIHWRLTWHSGTGGVRLQTLLQPNDSQANIRIPSWSWLSIAKSEICLSFSARSRSRKRWKVC